MDSVPTTQPELDPTKKGWAISALVLGIIYLLIMVPSTLYNGKAGSLPASFASQAVLLDAVHAVVALFFVIGASLSLKGNKIGIIILTYVPIAAIIVALLGTYFQYALLHSDAYTQFFTDKMMSKPGVTADMVTSILQKTDMFMVGVGAVFLVIELVYCIMLYIKMSAEPAETTA
jgi:hypothetical protein